MVVMVGGLKSREARGGVNSKKRQTRSEIRKSERGGSRERMKSQKSAYRSLIWGWGSCISLVLRLLGLLLLRLVFLQSVHTCKHCEDDVEFLLAADPTYVSTRPQCCRRPSSVSRWRCTSVGALVARHILTLTLGVLGLIVLGRGNLGGELKMEVRAVILRGKRQHLHPCREKDKE